ncbi:hypothetical protein E2C01_100054 [Portunus trituberculatus]|uniref:Uncharacterized protein n=1 Tax=Portunus trituberculatus TaxID=210409 RepID=A0A5B7KB18_PORTR|nr:hypothetical protein [Portunus trituberculatus]
MYSRLETFETSQEVWHRNISEYEYDTYPKPAQKTRVYEAVDYEFDRLVGVKGGVVQAAPIRGNEHILRRQN